MDKNNDGYISKGDLQEALRGIGLNFVGWKVWRAMTHSDLNHNGVIDPCRDGRAHRLREEAVGNHHPECIG